MINKLKKIITSEDGKRVFGNFVSLSALQGVNLILPLITFPYLVRVLGVDKYGLILFAQAFIAYFSLVADYGFNLSGTREISINRKNHLKLTRTYNAILQARLGLVTLGFIVMSVVVFSIPKFANDWKLYFLTYGMVVGNALFPTWFFQGMEKMKYITILSVIAKSIFTLSILIIVNSPSDYLWVPLLNSFGYVFIGLIALVIINRQFKIKFQFQKFKYINQQLKKGWYIFVSKISTNLYTATTTFVLGIVANNTVVGYYGIAEKTIRIIIALFAPFTQAIYPHVIQLVEKSKEETIALLSKVLKYTVLIALLIWLIAFVFALPIFKLVFGDNVEESIFLFRVLSPLIIIIPIASILFNIALLSFKLDKNYFKIYVTGALLNLILLGLFLFTWKMGALGASLSLLLCETVITIFAALILFKNNVKIYSFFNHIFTFFIKT